MRRLLPVILLFDNGRPRFRAGPFPSPIGGSGRGGRAVIPPGSSGTCSEESIEMSITKARGPLTGAVWLLVALPVSAFGGDAPKAKPGDKVSYYAQVRPIFQANCQGCHQPSKAGGGYVMTSLDRLMVGGDSKSAAIVPGKPEASHLVDQIAPTDGKAEMPKGKPPLSTADLKVVSDWIGQGAVDDTPASASTRYDQDHPPVYRRPPVIGALDYSPDGTLLAIGGFHEVLLWKADGSGLVARLVGLSERIESARFSPDGTRLAVTGGLPGRMGEVQVWDVAKKKLSLSVPITFDTVYGASWSPDGSKISLGCADNSVRAIDAKTGEQVLFMGSHNDWVLDTAFSTDGSHLISVGRDMAAKLTEVATQRFVDNITSITPGALKGGITSIARLAGRDDDVVGGSDGHPPALSDLPPDPPRDRRRLEPDPRVRPDEGPRSTVVASQRDRPAIRRREQPRRRRARSTSIPMNSTPNLTRRTQGDRCRRSPRPGPRPRPWRSRSLLHDGVKLVTKVDMPRAAIYALAFSPDGKSPRRRRVRRGRPGRRRLEGLDDPRVRPRPGGPAGVGWGSGRQGVDAEVRRAGRNGDPAERRQARRPDRRTVLDQARAPLRLRPGPRDRPAGVGRPDRRDPDGRIQISRRDRRGQSRGAGPAVGQRPGDARAVDRRAEGRSLAERRRDERPGQGRLRPRRQPRPVPAGLQRGDLPRLGAGQERLQALAPGLRPDLRRPGLHRRPGRPPGQRRLARR